MTRDQRPLIAYVVHMLSPFRVHMQRRIARELPGIRLATLLSWSQEAHLWKYGPIPEIGLATFPGGVKEDEHGTLAYVRKDWRAGARLIEWFERERPSACVACGYAFPSHYRLIRHLWRRRLPYFLWSDSNIKGDPTGPKLALKKALVTPVVRRAAGVLPCGEMGTRFYARYGAAPEKTFLSPVEPDYALIESPDPIVVREAVERFGLAPERRRLLVVARFIALKNIDLAIDAFAAIAGQRPDWDLVIVGDGPLNQALRECVPRGLEARVRFTGFIDRQELVAAIEGLCHVLVHPGYWEAWGVVLLEAAAAGMAIVTTDAVGAAPDLVDEGRSGTVVPARDPAALTRALLEATSDRLGAMRSASREMSRRFRERADPVRGLASALRSIGIDATRPAPGGADQDPSP